MGIIDSKSISCFQCEHLLWSGEVHGCLPKYNPKERFYRVCEEFTRAPGTENPENDIPEGVMIEIGQNVFSELLKGAKVSDIETNCNPERHED